MLRLEWLGLFGDRPARAALNGSPSDLVTELMLDRLGVHGYASGVRCRVVNRFDLVSRARDQQESVRSILDVADDGSGHSICSRLVSQTTAIAGRHLIDGELTGLTGLHHPYQRAVYEPVVRELEQHGLRNEICVETSPAERLEG
jgi:hypothetical protein